MQNRRSILLLFILCLLLSLGCRRKQPELIEPPDPPDPPCENGSCCFEGISVVVAKKLKGELAFYNGLDVLDFKEPLFIFQIAKKDVPYTGFVVCPSTTVNLPKIPFVNIFRTDSTPFKYRIWGRVLRATNRFDIAGPAVHLISVDRYEEVK